MKRVGDVAGTAAELASQRRHQERDVQDVHLVGQDLLRETAWKVGDGVEGQGATDQGGHNVSGKWSSAHKAWTTQG
jgi:hypothetical protein